MANGLQGHETVTCHGSLAHSLYVRETALKPGVRVGVSSCLLLPNCGCYFEYQSLSLRKKSPASQHLALSILLSWGSGNPALPHSALSQYPLVPHFWKSLCPRTTFLALLTPQIELLGSKNEESHSPRCGSHRNVYPLVHILDFWSLSHEGWPTKPAFAFFPVRGSRKDQAAAAKAAHSPCPDCADLGTCGVPG